MPDTKHKHCIRLAKAMNEVLGQERSSELLPLINPGNDEGTAEENYQWAVSLSALLEEHLSKEERIKVREQCSCIMTRTNSAFIKKLRSFRYTTPTDEEYLAKVADYLDGRGRCGKKVEYINSKIYSHWQFGNQCVCYLGKGSWKRSPSLLWCECCKGSALSVFKRLFDDKECHSKIVETYALEGASDCVFEFWWE